MSFAVIVFVNAQGQHEAAARFDGVVEPWELELAKEALIQRLASTGVLPAAMWATVFAVDTSLRSWGKEPQVL